MWGDAGAVPFAGKRGCMDGAGKFVDAAAGPLLYRSRSMGGTGASQRIGIELAVMAAIGLVAALTGPFGTFALPFGPRLAQWLLFAFGGYLCFRPVIAGGEALAASSALPRPAGIALACLLASLPTTLLVAWASSSLRLGRVTVGDLGGLYPQVLLLGALATAIQLAIRPRAPSTASMPPAADAPALPGSAPRPPDDEASGTFFDRLPPHLGRELLAVENEDHYLRVHTMLGDTLILMRMRDAVVELEPFDGRRVHRGWWVARAAIGQVLRRERAVALRLVNGLEVPVARGEVPTLRAAGWL